MGLLFTAARGREGSVSTTYDTFVPNQIDGLQQLIEFQQQVKAGSLTVDEALELFSDWQHIQKDLDAKQQVGSLHALTELTWRDPKEASRSTRDTIQILNNQASVVCIWGTMCHNKENSPSGFKDLCRPEKRKTLRIKIGFLLWIVQEARGAKNMTNSHLKGRVSYFQQHVNFDIVLFSSIVTHHKVAEMMFTISGCRFFPVATLFRQHLQLEEPLRTHSSNTKLHISHDLGGFSCCALKNKSVKSRAFGKLPCIGVLCC